VTSYFTRTLFVVCSIPILSFSVAAQDRPKIWEGVFTAEQSKRGHEVYELRCAPCHGTDLTGGAGPSLVGSSFGRSWGSRYLERLFKKLQTSMPAGDVTAIGDKEKVDILAYILDMNGFPAGRTELPPDLEYLSTVQIVGKNGPEPPPTGALVDVMGCLLEEGKDWKLTHATEPVVSTMDDPDADARAAANQPLGTRTVRLLDIFPRPELHKGHKMLAKGLLIRNNDNITLNVIRLGVVGMSCP
jgi:hypothetical protein